LFSLEKIKEYEISSPINSASLHPDQQVFVCGGEDFKMYKCDFTTGAELGIVNLSFLIFVHMFVFMCSFDLT